MNVEETPAIRAFIALQLSDKIKAAIGNTIDSLKQTGVQSSWIDPKQAHITLAFFKSISENEIKSLTERLRVILPPESFQIEISLGKWGCFPNIKNPRVLWLDVKLNNNDLIRLKTLLDREIINGTKQKIEYRSFRPHLTLARFKNKCVLKSALRSEDISFNNIPPQRIHTLAFFKSELSSQGAHHSIIAEILF